MGVDGGPLVVVSCDSHIGPHLDQLRPYCPRRHLAAFDEFAAGAARAWAEVTAAFEGRASAAFLRNTRTAGHHDGAARRCDMDRDGVAAEVIFHGSQNGQPMPFGTFTDVGKASAAALDPELAAVGLRIYHRWLADLVAEAPDRHVGLVHLPIWDVDASVRELEWAREAGLRGVNFPAPRPGLPAYNLPVWEPLWAAAADLGMPLATHAGSGGGAADYTGPEAEALQALEHGGWYARRALHWMVLSGVFERHPGLTLVLTEQPGLWWPSTLNELDSVYLMQRDVLRERVPRRPSEYCARSVYIGASFLAPFEAEHACREGYVDRVLWGSDYPHMEGTFQHVDAPDGRPPMTRLALRHTFAGVPADAAARMVGENAVRVYGLDAAALRDVARRIGAPTPAELATPLDERPSDGGLLAFRTVGPWA